MSKYDHPERGDYEIIGGLIIFLAIALLVGGYTLAWNMARQAIVCTVESKQATGNKDGGRDYLLFTKECGALAVADSWTNGKFNSSDTYASIKEGHSYTFETVGWRNGFLSTYPNVLSATD